MCLTKKLLAGAMALTLGLSSFSLPTQLSEWILTNNSISASAETSGDYEYEFLDDGTVEITAYTGSATELTIPSTIAGKKVASIGDYAFSKCDSLVNITIPNGVKSIGDSTFFDCPNLKKVSISDSVKSIGEDAFFYCINLLEVKLGKSITKIGNAAFFNCTSLTNIIIPNSVTSIGESTFEECHNLTSITIPDGIANLRDATFHNCSNLMSVTIGKSVTSIGYSTFGGCYSLVDINVDSNNKNYASQDGVLFNKDKTELIEYPVGNTRTSYIISNSVTSIREYAFSGCSSLTNVTIPNSVTSIGYGAFGYCSSLTSITIGKGVTNIEYYSMFEGCDNLTDINVDSNNKNYSSQYGVLFNKDKTELIKYPVGNTRTSYAIPNGVTNIEDYAFAWNDSLIKITMPDSVKNIGNSAFRWCLKLNNISLPDNGIKIGELAFLDCLNLKSVVIPKTATIGNCAFGYFNTIFNEQGQPVGGGGIWKDDNFDFKIKCYLNTAGEKYAINNGFDYELLDTPAHTHSYTSKIPKQPTCTSTGVRTYTCSCGDNYTETLPATGHKYLTTVIKPTYIEQGYTLHKCSVCGSSYKDNYTAKLTLATVSNFKVTKTAYNAIKLGWNAVPNADGYIIWRYDFAKKQWIKINDNVKTNSFLFTHLNSGTKYRFSVRAFKKVNGKTVTSPSFPVVDGYTYLPTVSNFKVTATANNAIKLGWNKVAGANGYYIYRYDYAKKQWKLINNNVKSNTFLFTHLNSGSNYKFAVRAFKKIDGKNILSQSFPTVGSSTNPATVNFKVTAGSKKSTVKWSKVTGATGYKVYYKTSKNGSWKLIKTANNKTTSYTKTGLLKGKTYYFTVKAYRTVGGKTYNGKFTTKSVKIK